MLAPGTVLRNRYVIGGILAQGGMSVLYHAQDKHLPGAWVVKQMRPITPSEEDRAAILEQFRREAAILATLSHPGLPRVIDSFEEEGYVYLVEELLPGRNLYEVASAHRFTEDDAVECARDVLRVLGYLHQHEIIYRDLKPHNIMVTDAGDRTDVPRYVLVDFGIARLFSVGKRRDTVLMGTPGFASPEHYGNRQTDPRSDIYSLGAVLHFLVTGHDPGETPFNFRPPDELMPGISEWFSDIVMKALETEPAERFQSAAEMLEALDTPRHLVLRAQTFKYPGAPSFLPSWERPLQAVSALTGTIGAASLAGSVDFLPLSIFFLIHPVLLFGRYVQEHAAIKDMWFVSTPRELQVWRKDLVTRVPWDDITWLRVRKYQRFFRPRPDRGEQRSGDTSIRVASIELAWRDRKRGRLQAARFTNELEGWHELMSIIISRANLRREARSNHPLADEEYRK
jgi:hypothetical protein